MTPLPTQDTPFDVPGPVNLSFVTLNVNGLGNPSKRRATLNSLRNAKHNICFLQETHSTAAKEKIWASEWGNDAFFAHGSSGSPTVHAVHRDLEGRFILLQASLQGWPVTLVNIYAPTADQPDNQIKFWESIERLLHSVDISNLILGAWGL